MDNSTPLISVGIPVVKTRYLNSALQGCLNQTYANTEIIILNNAATEETGGEIESIVGQYNDRRIKYYRNSSQLPIIENWNKVLSYAQGEFFSLLSDDDKWDKRYLEKMFDLSRKYPDINVFHSRVLIVDEGDKPLSLSSLCAEKEDCLDFIYYRIKGFRQQFVSDFMVKTHTIKQFGGFVDFPDGLGSDDITWFWLATTGGVAYNSEMLYTYRHNAQNVSSSKNIDKRYNGVMQYVEQVREITSKVIENTEFDRMRKALIKKELIEYQKTHLDALMARKIKLNRYVPNKAVPLIMLFYKAYIAFTGGRRTTSRKNVSEKSMRE